MESLDEKSMRHLEAFIPELAEGAVLQAHCKALVAGCTVVEARDGQLVALSPDGSIQVLKALPPATAVAVNQRLVHLKK